MKYVGELAGGTHLVEMNGADFEWARRLGALMPATSVVEKAPIVAEMGKAPEQKSAKIAKAWRRVATPPKKRTAATAVPTARKLPDGKVSVTPVLIDILRAENRAMDVTELAAGFKARTGLDHHEKVGICLATQSKHFERVGKGVYRLAGKRTARTAVPTRTAADIKAAAERLEEKGL